MSYLGRGVDKISNIETLDNITFNGASSYTLQKGGVNFVPTSAAAILISIDGVVQSGNFTVSSSTIDFGTAIASSSTCNFIIHLGTGVLTAPSDGSVTTARIADDAVTEAKLNLISTSSVPSLEAKGDGSSQDGYIQLNCSQNTHGIKLKSPPHSAGQSYTLTFPQSISADTFLKTDGSGNLSFAAAGGNMTPAFSVRQTTNQTGLSSDTLTKISFQSEVFDTDNAFASDKFTVPSGKAGRYFFDASTRIRSGTVFQLRNAVMYFYKNGSAMGDQYSAHYNSNLMLESRQNYSFVDDASVGDYYEIYATGTVDSGTVNLYQTTFTGFKILE